VRIVFKNLQVLWSIINAINASAELADIIEAVGSKIPNLFDVLAFSILLKENLDLYIYCDESSSRPFVDRGSPQYDQNLFLYHRGTGKVREG
jgi:hypothetical protein